MISKLASRLEPYVPGEQLTGGFIKLNTNESPYPACPGVGEVLKAARYEDFRLYPDPEGTALCGAIAAAQGVTPDMVLAGGGSDEVLGYAFMAFFDSGDSIYYPDVTYGFYPVLAQLFSLNAVTPPVQEDFRLNLDDYIHADGHIVIANPNAPTGIALGLNDIERILAANENRLLIADEAYVDFSDGKSCTPLLKRHKNLLIVRTYSKSYGMAGMRIGYALGAPELIDAMKRVKNSFNPYNFDRVSMAAGVAATLDTEYLRETAGKIVKTREHTRDGLEKLGFTVLPSEANFLFARRDGMDGLRLYTSLKENGILVRYFNKPRIKDFVRISIGTPGDMEKLLSALEAMI